jgi:hypothetical protein
MISIILLLFSFSYLAATQNENEVSTYNKNFDVLMTFYSLTGGTLSNTPNPLIDIGNEDHIVNDDTNGWKNSKNWGSNLPLQEWYGIHNNSNGEVTELELYSNNLQNGIPFDQLTELKNLEKLDLCFNKFTLPLSSDIGGLTALTRLQLSANTFKGMMIMMMNSIKLLHKI